MCWTGYYIPQIAERNIPIFKVVRERYGAIFSAYTHYRYFLNNLVVVKIEDAYDAGANYQEINRALHSYNPEIVHVIGLIPNSYPRLINIITESKRLDYFHNFDGSCKRANGFIPKGSIYCMNDDGEYISNQIILTEIVDI